jgi:hypothetical protein
VVETHGVLGVPSTVQVSAIGHVVAPHSVPVHSTSQRHDVEQLTLPQALLARHATAHAPVPQVTFPHAFGVEQMTSHEVPLSQSTMGQALAPEHLIVQA